MEIPAVKRSDDTEIPFYYHGADEDAAMDLAAAEKTVLKPGERDLVFTDFSAAIPKTHVGMVVPRSGLAIDHGITVLNSPGIVDPSYRGNIGVLLINHGNEEFEINKGNRISQFLIVKREVVQWVIVDNLNDTNRGEGGFGDSGV